jgi:site-specific DNA-methyltransferase (adenine-specific)
VAAEKLNRQWIGIDITHLAIRLMEDRLQQTFGTDLSPYEVIGTPKDLASAGALATQDKYRFESWALSLIDALPATGKKGSDRGIDGFIYFQDPDGKIRQILVSVKGGHINVSQVRDLIGTMQREKADIGAFITLEEPSHPMIQEAVNSGYYELQLQSGPVRYPRVQILTIKELFEGKRLLYPQLLKAETFRRAARIKEKPKSRELLPDMHRE